MASAFGWESAWDAYPDSHPDFAGIAYYDLPTERTHRLHKGDRFWMPEKRHLIEATDVRTKVYQGVVAPPGDEGADCVFYTPDWEPPRDPHASRHHTDDTHFISVAEFAEMLDTDDLVPHRGNGLRAPP